MPRIVLTTFIASPVDRVFDLARSIDAHVASTDGTSERAVGGRMAGLIGLGERVTWQACHLGVVQHLTVEITSMDRPCRFEDRMVSGAFKSMHHVHLFRSVAGGTEMTDDFDYRAPVPFVGRLVEHIYLTRYMTRFLSSRAGALKRIAESDEWRKFLPGA